MREDEKRDIVMGARRVAWLKRRHARQAGLFFRNDRGRQCASEGFRDALRHYGVTASMTRGGN